MCFPCFWINYRKIDQLSISSSSRKLVADDKILIEQLATARNLNNKSTKQLTVTSAEAVDSSVVDSLLNLSVNRIPYLIDFPKQAFEVTSSLLTNTAFPECEYIWQYVLSPLVWQIVGSTCICLVLILLLNLIVHAEVVLRCIEAESCQTFMMDFKLIYQLVHRLELLKK